MFFDDVDRRVYLGLLRRQSRNYGMRILGYCLMTNHVHLAVIPSAADSMAKSLRHAHGAYAQYFNAKQGTSGHLWQCRYYSCAVEPRAIGIVMRYVELNPVRAGLVKRAVDYPWSSARAHAGSGGRMALLDLAYWSSRWSAREWADCLAGGDVVDEEDRIRTVTHSGRPLGSDAYVAEWEERLGRKLVPGQPGRPKMASLPSVPNLQ